MKAAQGLLIEDEGEPMSLNQMDRMDALHEKIRQEKLNSDEYDD